MRVVGKAADSPARARTWTTQSCLTIFMIEISFLICCPMDCFWMRSLSRTLIATASPVSELTANFTFPNVPSPRVLPIWYLPTVFGMVAGGLGKGVGVGGGAGARVSGGRSVGSLVLCARCGARDTPGARAVAQRCKAMVNVRWRGRRRRQRSRAPLGMGRAEERCERQSALEASQRCDGRRQASPEHQPSASWGDPRLPCLCDGSRA